MSIGSRLKHAWNSFVVNEKPAYDVGIGRGTSDRPDRTRSRIFTERTIISSIFTRISVDVAAARMEHCRVDENEQYVGTINSGLNNCLKVQANIDQAGRHFRQDMALTMLNAGVVAIVPTDLTLNPLNSGNYDIINMRVGEVVNWYPEHVRVRLYNQKTGEREELTLPKSMVALAENPFYQIMNEPNSTLQRLNHKLSLLDNIDEISSSGKLDIIIQLPYVVKSETRRAQAKQRREELQEQLQNSTYGIAYTDNSEKITQLNRAVENNLLEQIKYLKEELYAELGLEASVMNGTADDTTMLNYTNRIIEPILDAITEAMVMTFITKTARTQGQTIRYFEDPFKYLPVGKLAEVTDVLSRNQIVTPNEIRPVLGLKPSKQPQANQLLNSNMPLKDQVTGSGEPAKTVGDEVDTSNPTETTPVADSVEAFLRKHAKKTLGERNTSK